MERGLTDTWNTRRAPGMAFVTIGVGLVECDAIFEVRVMLNLACEYPSTGSLLLLSGPHDALEPLIVITFTICDLFDNTTMVIFNDLRAWLYTIIV